MRNRAAWQLISFMQDYEELVSQGVNFTGKIVITRYGVIFRGLKVSYGVIPSTLQIPEFFRSKVQKI